MRGAGGNKERWEKGAVRLPKILVLAPDELGSRIWGMEWGVSIPYLSHDN